MKPSSLLPLPDDWLAFTFDAAVSLYGRYVTSEMNRQDKNGNYVRKLDDIIKNGEARKSGTIEQLMAMLGDGA